MVSIVPNYASIVATVVAVEPSAFDPAIDLVTLHFSELRNYQQYPNLVRPLPGDLLRVSIKRTTRETLGLKKDIKVSGLVRAAGGDKYFFNDDSVKVLNE